MRAVHCGRQQARTPSPTPSRLAFRLLRPNVAKNLAHRTPTQPTLNRHCLYQAAGVLSLTPSRVTRIQSCCCAGLSHALRADNPTRELSSPRSPRDCWRALTDATGLLQALLGDPQSRAASVGRGPLDSGDGGDRRGAAGWAGECPADAPVGARGGAGSTAALAQSALRRAHDVVRSRHRRRLVCAARHVSPRRSCYLCQRPRRRRCAESQLDDTARHYYKLEARTCVGRCSRSQAARLYLPRLRAPGQGQRLTCATSMRECESRQ